MIKVLQHLSVYGVTGITIACGAHVYMKQQRQKLEQNVYRRMEEGSKPRIPHKNLQLANDQER